LNRKKIDYLFIIITFFHLPEFAMGDFTAAILNVYDYSTTCTDWSGAQSTLYKLFGANHGTLRIDRIDGSSVNLFNPFAQFETLYAEKYQLIDPVRSAANRLYSNMPSTFQAYTATDLVAETTYSRSQFYREFAVEHGQNHMLLAPVGDKEKTIVSFFRDDLAFAETDKQLLVGLLPHLQRAIQINRQFQQKQLEAAVGTATIESLSTSAVVVDVNLNVLLANNAVLSMVSKRNHPVIFSNPTKSAKFGKTVLKLNQRVAGLKLSALVNDAATGGSGGSMRVEYLDEWENQRQLAILVSPNPTQIAGLLAVTHTVVLFFRDLSETNLPSADLLCALFNLTKTEAAVGLALLGGNSAESVSRLRNVSLETIRSQIRVILRKSGANNLRDFERIVSLVTIHNNS
jgi:DNA-binding CsgD family transcriptional regulator